jgi:hypothetical protein
MFETVQRRLRPSAVVCSGRGCDQRLAKVGAGLIDVIRLDDAKIQLTYPDVSVDEDAV